MTKEIFKAGEQSASDPFEFVMSTDSVDRMGDIVEQDWKLAAFRANPVALFSHRSDQPIGVWERVRVEGNKLVGRLKLAEKGTSELIDTLRSLIEQRILRAVSVGFRPGEAEPLDEKAPWNGYRLSKNELFECSLVSVPANAAALSLAKSLDAGLRAQLFAKHDERSACAQLGIQSQDSDIHPEPTSNKRPAKMSLSKKIETKQKQLNDLRDQLSALDDNYDADEDMPDEVMAQYIELSEKVDRCSSELDTLQKAEGAMQLRAAVQTADKPETKSATPRISTKKERAKGFGAFATVASLVKAHVDRTSPVALAQEHFKDDPEIEHLVRAATAPADTTTAGWAAELVRDTWGEFLGLLRDMSIYPALPGLRLNFDRYGKIIIPRGQGRGQLAGAWVEEGAPIPVKQGLFDNVDLQPKTMGVISSFTKQIANHSMPAIQQLVQQTMLEDTAEVLDTTYLDAIARSAVRPAGVQDTTETGGDNINIATGATAANIVADLKGMITRMLTARAGNAAVWILNPINIINLATVQDAASGEFIFSSVESGTLYGYPILSSQNVPVDLVVLQSTQAMAYASAMGPQVDVSDETTLVFDSDSPDDVLPDTNTQPAKSMFQTASIAVRLMLMLDHRQVRDGGRQVLHTVSWQ